MGVTPTLPARRNHADIPPHQTTTPRKDREIDILRAAVRKPSSLGWAGHQGCVKTDDQPVPSAPQWMMRIANRATIARGQLMELWTRPLA